MSSRADSLTELATAERLLRAGRAAEALQCLEAVPTDGAAHHHLFGIALAQVDRVPEAVAQFERALALAPSDVLLRLNFAALLRRIGDAKQAVSILTPAMTLEPRSSRVELDLAISLLLADDADAARHALQSVVQAEPANGRAWSLLGDANFMSDNFSAAVRAYQRAVEIEPSIERNWAQLAQSLRRAGRIDDAILALDRASRAGHRSAALLDARIGALLDAGRTAESTIASEALVETYPQYAGGYETRAHVIWEHEEDGDARARRTFEFGLVDQPKNAELRLAYVRWLVAGESFSDALTVLLGMPQGSAATNAAFLHAEALDRLGRSRDAEAVLDTVGAGHSSVALSTAQARHYLFAHDAERSAACALKAVEADSRHQEAWAYLVTAWRLLGDSRAEWLCDPDFLITQIPIEGVDIDAVGDRLSQLHTSHRAPRQQTLRNGTQTSGQLLERQEPVFAALRTTLLGEIDKWLRQLPCTPGHPFLQRNTGAARLVGSWSARLASGGRHVNHIHPKGWLSSAFYVSIPDEITRADEGLDGCLLIGEPPSEFNLDLPPIRIIHPVNGLLALFPAYLWHGTRPFQASTARLTVAFDMQPASTVT